MIHFDRKVCQNPEIAFRREWLETNGLGGFASSTIAGLNTRRYHGLLTAATKLPWAACCCSPSWRRPWSSMGAGTIYRRTAIRVWVIPRAICFFGGGRGGAVS